MIKIGFVKVPEKETNEKFALRWKIRNMKNS